jgi:anti-sigma factor RsiW
MHSCKETKDQITELLLDGAERSPDEVLSVELRRCAECRAEFDALKATLRITNRFSETAAPSESYWIGYHARLRERLANAYPLTGPTEFCAKAQRRKAGPLVFFVPLRLCARIFLFPVPVGIAVLVACLMLSLIAIRSARQQVSRPVNTTVVQVPVEVPVVQEKIVTRVVYRERRLHRLQQTGVPTKAESTFAKSQKSQNEDIPASLTGFKPTDEIKLTVIKGGSSNEK